jgi:putative ABC transport system permease protein
MQYNFALRLAWREARSSIRRLATYMIAVSVGIAALVAINSFRANVMQSVDDQARTLLGADIRISSNAPFPDSIVAVIDSMEARRPGTTATLVSTLSMALSRGGRERLVQLRGVRGPYPMYGSMETQPAGAWRRLEAGDILLEPALLAQLDTHTGDTLTIGGTRFAVAGVITNLTPEVNFRGALGARVFMSRDALERTGLLKFGSIASHEAYLRLPKAAEQWLFLDKHEALFERSLVQTTTAGQQARRMARAVDVLGRFLGLIGLGALLLGGIGVASAINVFIRSRRDSIAVLRCLGATQATAFTAYVLLATALGAASAAVGVLLGVLVQFALPALLRGVMSFDVQFQPEWTVVAAGLLFGTVITTAFALLPLLAVRGITPLRALRVTHEPVRTRDPWHALVLLVLAGIMTATCVWQADDVRVGIVFAATLAGALVLLWLAGALLLRLTPRFVPHRSAFPVRQGIANLHRPNNQTRTVTVAVGFGVFVLSALWVVQHNLLDWMSMADAKNAPNVVLIDVQPDQVAELRKVISRYATTEPEITPIVPARIAEIHGGTGEPERWAMRREYRHTWRAEPTGETIIAGRWWTGAREPGHVAEISVEEGLLHDLNAGLGDTITWDVQGLPVESVITSVRSVNWAEFRTNFFVVFQPGVLEAAPHTYVALVHTDSAVSGDFQREVAQRFVNVSAIDARDVQQTLQSIVQRVSFAIQFMALFSLAAGALVLLAALAAGRHQRIRESALLRVLGARRAQVRTILLTEYVASGILAGVAGILLGGTAGWLLVRFLFELPFSVPAAQLALLAAGVAALSAIVGLYTTRDALSGTPLQVIRDTFE